MHIKRYFLLSIFFLVAVGGYIHYNINTMYNLDIYNQSVNLPIAIWMLIPAILLLVLTIFHFSFFNTVRFFKERKLQKDLNQIPSMIEASLVQKTNTFKVADKRLKTLADFMSHAKLEVSNEYKSSDEKIQKAIEKISSLESGEVTDIDEYKLNKSGAIYQRNLQNRLKSDNLLVDKALNEANSGSPLFEEARELLIKTADKKSIEKNNLEWNSALMVQFLGRNSANDNGLDFEYDEIKGYLSKVELSKYDYIALAKKLFNQINPDEIIELFYHLQHDFDNANGAYLYINLELEKMDEAKAYLEQYGEDDLEDFRFYLILKENGAKVTLSQYIK